MNPRVRYITTMANSFTAGAANRKAAADFLENPEFMRDTYRGVTLHEHTGVNIPILLIFPLYYCLYLYPISHERPYNFVFYPLG